MKILILEPYFGGSHKHFLTDLAANIAARFTWMTLPARKWKWRMRLAAPLFAEQLFEVEEHFNCILCSTFVDVATLRGMGPSWLNTVPVCTYFHENQFAYPVQVEDERDFHFALTNWTTAQASDRIAFNSYYNRQTMMAGIESLVKKAPDMVLKGALDKIKFHSEILPPGLDFSAIDAEVKKRGANKVPVVVWNHRWEHDKNPELFFETLFEFDRQGIEFNLIVMGQAFARRPAVFDTAGERLAHRIIHFGYAKTRQQYLELLSRGDIIVSTADHEFYGIAVLEAIRAGCRPLLPNRLSYPELFPQEYLYEDEGFSNSFKELLINPFYFSRSRAIQLTEPYSWENLAQRYWLWLSGKPSC